MPKNLRDRNQPGAGFPKSARLLRHSEFEHVYKNGRRHFSPSMTVFYLVKLQSEVQAGVRVGFTVGRVLGGSVARSRIKRRLREAVRRSLGGLNVRLAEKGLTAEIVINPKKAALTMEASKLEAEVQRAFTVVAG